MEEWASFASVLVTSFSLVTLLAGIFTAYFGTGRSRIMGIIFVLMGLAVGAAWGYLCMGQNALINVALLDVLKQAFLDIAAAILGFALAAVLFLLAIMKV